jgi:hypothetical protein
LFLYLLYIKFICSFLPSLIDTVNAIDKDFKQVSVQNSSKNPNLPTWSLPSAFKNLLKHWKLWKK